VTFQTLNNVYSGYSWIRGDYDDETTEAEIRTILSKQFEFLRKISPNPKTYFFDTTEYFPHVSPVSLQEGFYQKLDKIQGMNGIYYASTLLTLETMRGAIEMGDYIGIKYFPGEAQLKN